MTSFQSSFLIMREVPLCVQVFSSSKWAILPGVSAPSLFKSQGGIQSDIGSSEALLYDHAGEFFFRVSFSGQHRPQATTLNSCRYFGTDGRAEGGEKVGYRYVAIHRGRLVLDVISCPYHRDTCEAFGKSGSFTDQSVFPQ